jgi:predicted GIY-YIG superfamily endonuclease
VSEELHTLYRFYGQCGELLYVGITCSPSRRFREHSEQKSWWVNVAQIHLEQFESRRALVDAERVAIERENPKHNLVAGIRPTASLGRRYEPFTRSESKALQGKYFHSDDESGLAGQITARAGGGMMWVVVIDWCGGPNESRLVPMTDIVKWSFYPDAESWELAYREVVGPRRDRTDWTGAAA